MGFFQEQLKKLAAPLIQATIQEMNKSDQPKVTEVPTQMQIGYSYTGGARRKYGSMIDFDTLRTFSVVYDVARVCINHRKRQINNLEWAIVPKDEEAKPEKFKKAIAEITTFFEEPMPNMDFKTWVDRFLEDLLVLDAGVLWKDKTIGGQLLGLLPIDGATLRLKVESDGTTPLPPEIAYQQVTYGEVSGEWTTDEMYYKYMNPRTNTPYGLSPLECLIIGVDAALRSQMANAALLSEGSVPEGFMSLPEAWTTDQIKDYQMWFDSLLAGNLSTSARIKMIPGGKGVGYIPTKKQDDMRMNKFEEWLLMKTCAMFDVQPRDIGFEINATPGSGDTQQELGNQRGLVPMANFIKAFFTEIIKKDFGRPDLKFEWKGLQVVDNTFELDRAKAMIEHGAMTINEFRVAQGFEPLKNDNADMPMVYNMNPVLLDKIGETPEPTDPAIDPESTAPSAVKPGKDGEEEDKNQAENEIQEMFKWESKVLNYMKRGKGMPKFEALYIDKSAATLIQGRLSVAKSKDEVKVAFAPFLADAQERALIKEALGVNDKISAFKRKRYEPTGSST